MSRLSSNTIPGIGRQAECVHELEARRRRIGDLKDTGVDGEELCPGRGNADDRSIRAIAVVSRAIVGPADVAPLEILPGVAAPQLDRSHDARALAERPG